VKPDVLRKAIFFHNKHRENSDSVGKFVAHLNMGLAYAQLGEREASTVNHQYALRYALQLHSLEGQSLAIGSLGFSAGMYDNDPEKMRVLIERYVHLCDTLKQPRNQASALKKLGIIASQQGESEQSIQYFQQALDCAKATGDREAEKDCSVRLGIAAGQAKMADHISTILQSSVMQA
jgi:tetratricopeptide (TPR) repeat protein